MKLVQWLFVLVLMSAIIIGAVIVTAGVALWVLLILAVTIPACLPALIISLIIINVPSPDQLEKEQKEFLQALCRNYLLVMVAETMTPPQKSKYLVLPTY